MEDVIIASSESQNGEDSNLQLSQVLLRSSSRQVFYRKNPVDLCKVSQEELEYQYKEFLKETPSKFVNAVPPSLECSLCRDILKCGHYFCRGCIIRAYENKKECPIDRKPLRGKVDNNLLPNFLAREQIENLLIYCPFGLRRSNISGEWVLDENSEGCKEKIPYGKKSHHEKECPYAIVQCRVVDDETGDFCKFTCFRKDLEAHQSMCEYKPLNCPNEGCAKRLSKKRLCTHMEMCDRGELECEQGCGRKVKRRRIEEHSCDFSKCPFSEYGCDHKCLKSELDGHLHSTLSIHLLKSLQVKFTLKFLIGKTVSSEIKNRFSGMETKVLNLQARYELFPPNRSSAREINVDASGGGDYSCIQAAIEAAASGDHILVHPGTYKEFIVVNKPVHIKGIGRRGEIILEPSNGFVLKATCEGGSITNLTLRKNSDGEQACVWIPSGSILVQQCDISSESLACVEIEAANPRILNNDIHSSPQLGIFCYYGGGLIEGNQIHDNYLDGIAICEGANPTLRNNTVFGQGQSGIRVYDKGRGVIEENQIFENANNGIEIDHSFPQILNNHIYQNSNHGIEILPGSNPKIKDNKIVGCKEYGIVVSKGSIGLIENNKVMNNERGEIKCEYGCQADLINNTVA